MTNASQLAFIRTQAETFAWAAVAAKSLVEMDVLDFEEYEAVKNAAVRLIRLAKGDPKFIGDKLPTEFK